MGRCQGGVCERLGSRSCSTNGDCDLGACGLADGVDGGILFRGNVDGATLGQDDSAVLLLSAVGDVTVEGDFRMNGSDGGFVSIETAGGVSWIGNAKLRGLGDSFSDAGSLFVSAGNDVHLQGSYEVSGKSAGDLFVESGGSCLFEAEVAADSSAEANAGGVVEVECQGDLLWRGGTVRRPNGVNADGAGLSLAFGSSGDGGDVYLSAGGDLVIEDHVALTARTGKGGTLGRGGSLTLLAGGDIRVAGVLAVEARGAESWAGELVLDGTDLFVEDSAELSNAGFGGTESTLLLAQRDLLLAGKLTLVSSHGAGPASSSLAALRYLEITGDVERGTGLRDGTNEVIAEACVLKLAGTADFDNRASRSLTNFRVGKSFSLEAEGRLRGSAIFGVNVTTAPTAAAPIFDGELTPFVNVDVDPLLPGCSICGDSVVDPGETCDDGNLDALDGCDGRCISELCKAGTSGDPLTELCSDNDPCTLDVCVHNLGCLHPAKCDDGVDCTADSCVDGECSVTPQDELCADQTCQVGVCRADGGCGLVAGNEGASCDDADACTVNDVCTAGVCTGESGVLCLCGNGNLDDPEQCDDGDELWSPGEACLADCRDAPCARPVSAASSIPKAADALFILRAAVGIGNCALSVCDVDGSNSVSSADALAVLLAAVRLDLPAGCL